MNWSGIKWIFVQSFARWSRLFICWCILYWLSTNKKSSCFVSISRPAAVEKVAQVVANADVLQERVDVEEPIEEEPVDEEPVQEQVLFTYNEGPDIRHPYIKKFENTILLLALIGITLPSDNWSGIWMASKFQTFHIRSFKQKDIK